MAEPGPRLQNRVWRLGLRPAVVPARGVTNCPAGLDEGPIIAQGTIPVDHSHSAAEMARAGRDVEKIVLARALKLLFEDRVFVPGRRTVTFG